MNQSDKEEIINVLKKELSKKADVPFILCGYCDSGKRECPHLVSVIEEQGSPRRCLAQLSFSHQAILMCVLEYSNRCAIWDRIKEEWAKVA